MGEIECIARDIIASDINTCLSGKGGKTQWTAYLHEQQKQTRRQRPHKDYDESMRKQENQLPEAHHRRAEANY